ncbi:MAG: hypothetical protein C0170_01690 [Hydrogenobaculum sp.]|nr:MAG: hypothetical protein C0170_01690 [Hydrogenobaculum sp.]
MGILFDKKDFLPLVGYSFSLLGRIGKELSLAEDLSVLRNITLLGIRFDKKDESILKALIDSTRTSDAFFVFEDLLVLLLFGTDKEGAIHIVNELKEFFGQNMFYTIATSPEDGDDASTLVENFRGMVKLKLSLDIYTL